METDALVVGASWAGIWTLHLLNSRGYKVLLVDPCQDVGGTWCYTLYPGCRVDTEIPLYEFSDPDIWKNWTWSQRFPEQKEIQAYISWVTDRPKLRENLVFETRVNRAEWNEGSQAWTVSVSSGAIYHTKYLILCTGYATIPYIPEFKGAELFKNRFHSSAGLQLIEALGPHVAQLSVFQRTPNLATPMRQQQCSGEEMVEMKRQFYPDMLRQRNSITGFFATPHRSTFDDDPEARDRFFQGLWETGGLAFWFGNYADLLTSRKANREAYNDKVVAEKLAPATPPHPFGTKRPSLEAAYFKTFNLPHVDLVDVRDDPIQEITATGVQTATMFHELDMLVYATGFDALTVSALAIDIVGVEGIRLQEKWDIWADGNGVSTALGLMTAGFPNMFFPMGPHGPSALGLSPQLAEIQGGWVVNCIEKLKSTGLGMVEATKQGEEEWKKGVRTAAESTLFGGTDLWYMGVNIPGRKKQPLCYFGGVGKYVESLQQAVDAGYEGFTMS
ncbi:hypothetical protein BDW59DRAFT_179535 [Aspergillus cavernicola]|uniref:L-ornithine N(5)-monooxygenase n=1 Tax=Aspergillus cavernicola TaxID=176166 RepID=A0ABR4IF93_9EURO